MVCGTADILMKFLSLGWFGLGYDCFCKRLHARKLIGKASPKEATTRGFLALDLFAMLGVEVLVCLIAMAQASSQVLTYKGHHAWPRRALAHRRRASVRRRCCLCPLQWLPS